MSFKRTRSRSVTQTVTEDLVAAFVSTHVDGAVIAAGMTFDVDRGQTVRRCQRTGTEQRRCGLQMKIAGTRKLRIDGLKSTVAGWIAIEGAIVVIQQ